MWYHNLSSYNDHDTYRIHSFLSCEELSATTVMIGIFFSICILTVLPFYSSFSVNAARGRATAQSSTFEAAYPGKAVDGNRDTNYWHGSCSHTHDEASAWWRVDLGRQYTIGTIRITNRASSWNRLSNFDVQVGRSVSSYYSYVLVLLTVIFCWMALVISFY